MHSRLFTFEDSEIASELKVDFTKCKLKVAMFKYPAGTCLDRIQMDYWRSVLTVIHEGKTETYQMILGLVK
jgi:hypothetical protein